MAPTPTYRKKKLGSYPYFLVVFSITLALFIIGFFGSLLLFGNKLTRLIKEDINIQVYLQKDLSADSIKHIQVQVANRPYVQKQVNVPQVTFISKDSSARKFISETGEDFLSFLGDNPLRDAFVVKIDPLFSENQHLQKIKADLEGIPGVFEVLYTENLIDAIHKNIQKITLAFIVFAAVLISVIFLLINNTVKLAMFSQRFLIRSMQLVGARPFFIQKPYLFRSFTIGLLGGMIASALLVAFLEYAKTLIPDIQQLEDFSEIAMLVGMLIAAGGLIGLVSSFLAVNKYMKKSLNDLY